MEALDMEEAGRGADWRRWMLIGLVVLALLALIGYAVKGLIGNHGDTARKPPKISLIPATPPPPPPKEEKRPEPPKVQKEDKVVQEERKDEPPPDQSLKMEGAAGDGPSMFGAGKVSNEDLSRIGAAGQGTGSGAVSVFNSYAMSVKGELQRTLARKSELRRRQYKVEVLVWVADDGHLKRYELLGSTRDDDTDEAIRAALAALPGFSEPPPARMPFPIKLRIVASGRA